MCVGGRGNLMMIVISFIMTMIVKKPSPSREFNESKRAKLYAGHELNSGIQEIPELLKIYLKFCVVTLKIMGNM